MPRFTYFCTGLVADDGYGALPHEIDVPQEDVDRDDPPTNSKMGRMESKPGNPPVTVFCTEHQAWATAAPLNLEPRLPG